MASMLLMDGRGGPQAIFDYLEYTRGRMMNLHAQPSWLGRMMGYEADSPEQYKALNEPHWHRPVADDVQ